eukprot:1406440-Prymnesium_polylepis.2
MVRRGRRDPSNVVDPWARREAALRELPDLKRPKKRARKRYQIRAAQTTQPWTKCSCATVRTPLRDARARHCLLWGRQAAAF